MVEAYGDALRQPDGPVRMVRGTITAPAQEEPRAVTETTIPAAVLPPIVFGTDGWRARIADEFTYENVRRCAEGVAHFVRDEGASARGVVIGFDRRFASEYFAQKPDATHRALILTDGVQTTGTVVVNSPDFTSAVAADLAARVPVPDLSGVSVTVAGLGQVVGDPPPSEFVAALNTFFTDTCARTNATCQIVTDLASN